MPIRIVQSKQNARLKELRRALANPGRNESRPGRHRRTEPCSKRRCARGCALRRVFVAQGSEQLIERLKLPPEIEVLMLPRELLDSALATETPQAIAALVEPPDWTWAHLLGTDKSAAPLIVVLAGIAGSGQPGHNSAIGRGLWSRRRRESSGNGQRLEPKGGSSLGGKRLSSAYCGCERG